jgi:hypothetical protein
MSERELLERLKSVEAAVAEDRRALRSLGRIEVRTVRAPDLNEVHTKDPSGLTIFIPNWNHAPYLPRALRSALDAAECLREAGFGAEVIVADDASRDGSRKLLRSVEALYEEPRLKTVFLEENLGLPRLRNLGLALAGFRYVCLLDADNELVPENLPLFARSIAQTGATVVYGNLLEKRGGKPAGLRSRRPVNERIFERNQVDAFSVVDAEKLLTLGGYASDPQLYGREDWEMILHLIAEEEKIVFVPAVLGHYHTLPLSMMEETRTQREEGLSHLRRVYSQNGPRRHAGPLCRIYHPDAGYLDGGQP